MNIHKNRNTVKMVCDGGSVDDSDSAFEINHSFKVREACSDHRVQKHVPMPKCV